MMIFYLGGVLPIPWCACCSEGLQAQVNAAWYLASCSHLARHRSKDASLVLDTFSVNIHAHCPKIFPSDQHFFLLEKNRERVTSWRHNHAPHFFNLCLYTKCDSKITFVRHHFYFVSHLQQHSPTPAAYWKRAFKRCAGACSAFEKSKERFHCRRRCVCVVMWQKKQRSVCSLSEVSDF